MGGRLSVESTPGRGTTSTLALPLAAASPASGTPHSNCEACNPRTRPARKRPQPRTRRRTRIVFADDHRIVRESLIALIKNEPGIEVVGQCENGSEAVDLAGKLQPDVVIMDGNMPVMDGIAATRAIRESNTGILVAPTPMLKRWLAALSLAWAVERGDCDRGVSAAPADVTAWRCYYQAARNDGPCHREPQDARCAAEQVAERAARVAEGGGGVSVHRRGEGRDQGPDGGPHGRSSRLTAQREFHR
jgi:CheY-like chemotaxis protein